MLGESPVVEYISHTIRKSGKLHQIATLSVREFRRMERGDMPVSVHSAGIGVDLRVPIINRRYLF